MTHARTPARAELGGRSTLARRATRRGPNRLVVHVVLPAVVTLVLLLLFFSGDPRLASIVASPDNRELGVLEHLQLVPIVAIAVWAFAARRREPAPLWRWLWLAAALGAAFVALEELNYGQHHLALITGRGSEAEVGPLSLHNIGDRTDRFKLVADLGMAALFLVVPLVREWTGRALLGPYTPGLWYVASLALFAVLAQGPHLLSAIGRNPGWMTYNLSEFRELLIYYIGAVYVWDLTRVRRLVISGVTWTSAPERAEGAPRAHRA